MEAQNPHVLHDTFFTYYCIWETSFTSALKEILHCLLWLLIVLQHGEAVIFNQTPADGHLCISLQSLAITNSAAMYLHHLTHMQIYL